MSSVAWLGKRLVNQMKLDEFPAVATVSHYESPVNENRRLTEK